MMTKNFIKWCNSISSCCTIWSYNGRSVSTFDTLIERKGGQVTDLNSDAITCTFEDNKFPFDLSDGKNIDGYYWDDDKTILKYKLEPVGKHVLYPKME